MLIFLTPYLWSKKARVVVIGLLVQKYYEVNLKYLVEKTNTPNQAKPGSCTKQQ